MQDGHNDYLILTREYLSYKRLMDMRKGWIEEMNDTQSESYVRAGCRLEVWR